MKSILAIGLIACVAMVSASSIPQVRFDDFKVYEIFVQGSEQLSEIKKLADDIPVQYLTDIGAAGRSYQIVVPPANEEQVQKVLDYFGFSYKILIQDLQSVLEKRLEGIMNPVMNWTSYHQLDDIYNWLDNLVLNNPFILKPYIIGYSYEGRPIKALKLSRRKGNKAIFVESNIHAIEWISSAAGTCFLNNLLTSEDPEVQRLSLEYDWIFVPIVNPDGFVYTHTKHPLWRKNRKPTGVTNSSGICYGVDMNRNFDAHWNVAGYNIDVACDHWYGGSQCDSEPEVQALQRFVNSFDDKDGKTDYIRVYTALHSYGNMVLLPYGHTNTEFPPNYEQMMRIANGFADAARVKFGTKFRSGASGLLNYPVSGSAKDWAYEKKGIQFSATIELRDLGTYGFFLPANQILAVCEELTDGYVGLVKAAEAENLFD